MKRRVEQFAALGQQDRLEIFRLLVRAGYDGKCVDEIKRRLKMPGSTLSHHLDTLARSGLLAARRSGRFIYYAVNWREASGLIRFLIEDCCAEMNVGSDGAPVTLRELECCVDAQESGKSATRAMRLSREKEMEDQNSIKERVRKQYAREAERVLQNSGKASFCGSASSSYEPITSNLYAENEKAVLPEDAVAASLGCGNPTALADLKQGETVLDLGSGGGIDVLLSARRVGPTGKAYGLDMTDEMLALARENQRKAGVENVEFLKGEIENIPLPDSSVNVIISNCVINLSADKGRVTQEAFRVLKPGGRFAVSDVVVRGEMPGDIQRRLELWAGCIAGALADSDYRSKLSAAGFEEIEIEPTRIYTAQDAKAILSGNEELEKIAQKADGKFMSAFIRARKPAKV